MQMDNHSKYVRDLVNQDRLAKGDPQYIKLRRQELKDQIKALDETVRAKTEIPDQAIEVLNKWFTSYKSNNRPGIEDHFNLTWIKDQVIPDLKAVHCHSLDNKQILGIFQDHFKEGRVLIDVG